MFARVDRTVVVLCGYCRQIELLKGYAGIVFMFALADIVAVGLCELVFMFASDQHRIHVFVEL